MSLQHLHVSEAGPLLPPQQTAGVPTSLAGCGGAPVNRLVSVKIEQVNVKTEPGVEETENQPQIEVIPCKVCGDKSSGVHYGVITCEGCKGFFRRSQSSVCNYQCPRQKACTVDRVNRNRCQFCRLKKCLELGMSRDAVKFGRMSKKQREKVRLHKQMAEANGMPFQSYQEYSPTGQQQSYPQTYDYGLFPHYDTAAYTHPVAAAPVSYQPPTGYGVPQQEFEMKCNVSASVPAEEDLCTKVTQAFNSSHNYIQADLSLTDVRVDLDQFSNMSRPEAWSSFSNELTRVIQCIIEFAKMIDGFMRLKQEDQIHLLKQNVFELAIIALSTCYSIPHNCVVFCGKVVPFYAVSQDGDQEGTLVRDVFTCLHDLASYNLSKSDLALLSAIVLLENAEGESASVEMMKANLANSIIRKTNNMTISTLVLEMIPRLRAVSRNHRMMLLHFKDEYPEVELPALYKELFSEV